MSDPVEKQSWVGPVLAIILGLALVSLAVLSILFGPGAIYPETRVANVTWSEADYSSVSGVVQGFVLVSDDGEQYYLPSTLLNGDHWVAFPQESAWNSLSDASFSEKTHVVKYNTPYRITIWHAISGGYTTDVFSTWKMMPRISNMEKI